jgi:pilus assembly protein FimV
VLSPVESESIPLEADVDSAATELFVVLRPVDSEPT